MNRTEFLAAISLRLQDLPVEERDEAVKYYSEYLDEVGPEREDAVIGELGGAEKVSNIIRANCGYGPVPQQPKPVLQPELTLEGPSYSTAERFLHNHAPKAPDVNEAKAAGEAAAQNQQAGAYTENGTQQASQGQYTDQQPQAGASYSTNGRVRHAFADTSSNHTILWIIILVISFPIWSGLAVGLLGGAFGLLGGMIGIVIGGIGAIVAGLINFVAGIFFLSTSVASGLATMGVSLFAFAMGVLLFAGGVWLLKKAVPFVIQCIGNLLRWIGGKVGR